MSTLEHDVPPLADGMELFDRIRMMEDQSGHSLAEARQMALDGDPLEMDLLRSGFYEDGETDEVGDPEIEQQFALRALGDYLIRLREAAVERRWGVDEQTLLNFAFRSGHHYVEVDRARRAVVHIPAPRDAVRRAIPKFEPWYRHQHSRLSGGEPAYQIQPTTQQQEDRDATELAQRLIASDRKFVHSHRHKSEVAMWQILAGGGILLSWIEYEEDPDYLTTVMADPETGEPIEVPIPKPVIKFDVIAPQMVWCDDRQLTVDDMRWLGVDRPTSLAEAIAAYPEHEEKLVPEDGVGEERGLRVIRKTQRMTASPDPWNDTLEGDAGPAASEEEEEVLLLEFRLKPGAALRIADLDWLDPQLVPYELASDPDSTAEPVCVFPAGLFVCLTTDGHILEISELEEGFIAAQEVKFSKSSGLWSHAPATPLRTINQALDWAFSLWEEHLLRTGRPKELIPRQAHVRRRGSLNVSQRVEYRASATGAKPEFMDPPPMPADGIRYFERLELLWMDVAGVHEVSQGKLPAGDISGVAISLLQEQDLAQLGFAGADMEQAFVNVMRQRLRLVQRFYPRNDPRLVKLAGDKPYLVDAFMQAEIDEGLDIKVVPGTVIPRSPAAVKAEAKEAWQLGILVDKYGRPDIRRMQALLEFGSYEDLYADDEANEQNARAVEDLILALPALDGALVLQFFEDHGMFPPQLMPQPEDDHMIFERSHRLRLVRARQDERVGPINLAVLRLKWQIHLTAIFPVLLEQDPATAIGAIGAAPQEGGKKGSEPAAA